MSPAVSTTRIALLILLLAGLFGPTLADTDYRYESTDGRLIFQPSEEFQRTANPHAILSLQNTEEVVVLVTSDKRKFTITQIYDGMPATFDEGAACVGRVLLDVGGEDAATFLVEGMFPPNDGSTHNTVYTVTNRDEIQYTIMIHYPVERGEEGFEWATSLLGRFSWAGGNAESESTGEK